MYLQTGISNIYISMRPKYTVQFTGTTPAVYPSIIKMLEETSDQDSRIGGTREAPVVTVHSYDPRERWLTRPGINWAFGLQESFAYWMGQNPGHVERYNSQMENYMYDEILHGSAYGRYLRHFPHDQIERVLHMLEENPNTRRAVINIHNAYVEDYDGPDVACTIYLHPFVRDGKLHMVANLRSQDMLWGYPYDTQAFQWMQEVMAGVLGVELGEYWHIMNSAHYYTEYEDKVLESAYRSSGAQLPDCRLDRESTAFVMNGLKEGLQKARDGDIPYATMSTLSNVSGFYADWLCVMTAYEQKRFHDDAEAAAQIAKMITTKPLKSWALERVD